MTKEGAFESNQNESNSTKDSTSKPSIFSRIVTYVGRFIGSFFTASLIQQLKNALQNNQLEEAQQLALRLKKYNLRLPASLKRQLQASIECNRPKVLQILMEAFQVNLNIDASFSLAGLICEPKVEVARILIQKGAVVPVNAKNSLLHVAATIGASKCTRMLIEEGAIVDQINDKGETPLHNAAQFGRVDCVRLLIERKANVNQPDNKGETPLDKAVSRWHIPVVKFLLDIEDVQKAAYVGRTLARNDNSLLCHTARQGDLEFVNRLLTYPEVIANITAGNNAALKAARNNHHQTVVNRLLEFPAMLDFERASERNPLLSLAQKRAKAKEKAVRVFLRQKNTANSNAHDKPASNEAAMNTDCVKESSPRP